MPSFPLQWLKHSSRKCIGIFSANIFNLTPKQSRCRTRHVIHCCTHHLSDFHLCSSLAAPVLPVIYALTHPVTQITYHVDRRICSNQFLRSMAPWSVASTIKSGSRSMGNCFSSRFTKMLFLRWANWTVYAGIINAGGGYMDGYVCIEGMDMIVRMWGTGDWFRFWPLD